MANVKLSQITASPAAAVPSDAFVAVHGGNTDFLFTPAQLQAALANFSTVATTAGMVPGSNNVGVTNFLRADGVWAIPPGNVSYGNNQLLYSDNAGTLHPVTAGTAGQMLTFNGVNWSTNPPTWTTPPGGTPFGNNNLLYSDNTGVVHQLAAGASGTILQSGGTNWTTTPPFWIAPTGGGNVTGTGTSAVRDLVTFNNATATAIVDSADWAISATHQLYPLVDNTSDIGISATNRIRAAYVVTYNGATYTFLGATSGQVSIGAPATVTSYSMTLPAAAPAASSGILVSAAGVMSFAANLGVYGNVTDTNILYFKDNSGNVQKLAAGTAGQVLTNNGPNFTTNPPTWSAPTGTITPPTVQRFTTTGAFTWNRPAGCTWIEVEMVAGGGGGAGSGTSAGIGVAGGNTTFGNAQCIGGGGGSTSFASQSSGGGANMNGGGTFVNASLLCAVPGCAGAAPWNGSSAMYGGMGASSPLGGGGAAGCPGAGGGGTASGFGAGGGGGGIATTPNGGGGGAAGGYLHFIVTSPVASYVGNVATAGTGGVNGTGGGGAGSGTPGIVTVIEHYGS